MKLEFSSQVFEKSTNTKVFKIRALGSQLYHADTQADMTKLIEAFGNFANAPKTHRREIIAVCTEIHKCTQAERRVCER